MYLCPACLPPAGNPIRPTLPPLSAPHFPPSRAQAAEQQLAAQLARLQTREAGLAAAVCQAQAENLQLRQALHVAKQAAEPSVVQLRQLLLDPAVNREFAGLRAELEARLRDLQAAQLELAARQFGGPDPLLGKIDELQVRGKGGRGGAGRGGCTGGVGCTGGQVWKGQVRDAAGHGLQSSGMQRQASRGNSRQVYG